jgi:hypothetical protein
MVRRLCAHPSATADDIETVRERTIFNSGRSAMVAAKWISDFLDRRRDSHSPQPTPDLGTGNHA